MTIRILLVDDSLTFISSVRLFLGMLPGVQVVGEAHNGHDALDQVGHLQPDLVLLDIAMPVMNGLEVARRLKAMPKAPRIVFVSMNDRAEYRAAARELGVADFVDKAYFVVELFPLIKRLTGAGAVDDVAH